ncbi:phosphomannomutase/phosphoglucomutase [Patescibacteria group bacterium]|nr:phosphomannomutase/phosphoglucomutase [Patescibacteria group bacterium]MCL5797722.1 phosphomannomutase/phosphoglucomutase [Patescibacteria group bacterium]
MSVNIDTKIFHDYDIRGTYPDQLNEETFYITGKAISSYLKVDHVAVGHDTRLSSPSLFQALTKGIMDQGTNVVNLGLISTEMNYFASGEYGFPASIIVSASHNPANYNGLKIVKQGVVPLNGNFGLPEIKALCLSQNFPLVSKKGTMTGKIIMEQWIEHALKFIDIGNLNGKIKLVVDAGNGMGGISWQEIKKKLPIQIIPLYFEPDGHFPHHLPDPLKKENVQDLKREIVSQKAGMGFAIDGDADRLFVLDEKGNELSGTVTTAILATALLQKFGPSPILYNVVCGRIVPEKVRELGGDPVRVRVGHSFIKEYMKKTGALFGGEHSGHFYFRDNFRADSSTIAGLIFLEYVSKQNKKVSEIVSSFDKYKESGEINFRTQEAKKIITILKDEYKSADSIDELDGLSVWFKEWWFNLRASNTEPFIRLNIEADDDEALKTNKEVLFKRLGALGAEKVTK